MSGVKAGTAFIDIRGDWSAFDKDMDSALGKAEGKWGKFGGKAKAAAAGVAAVGAAALVAGKALYDIGGQFDDAYDTIRVNTGATGKNLDGLKKDFKEVVKSVPTDFGSAGTAVADLNTRLGITGKPLRNLSKQMLELSRITKTDLGTNIESVTRTFGDWGIKVSQQGPALDKMFRASQATGVSVSKLGEMMVKYGAPLRQLGFSFEESAAMIGKFEKEGVNTQLVMGSMRVALGKMAKAGEDPQKTFRRVTDEIKNAGSAGEANALALELFGARAGPDMAAAIREGRFELGDLTKQISSGGDTIMKAGKDTQDFSEKWQMLKNQVFVKLEPLAVRVFGAISTGMDMVGPAAQRVAQWVGALQGVFQRSGESSGRMRDMLTRLRTAIAGVGDIAQAVGTIASAAWATFGDLVIERAQNMLDYVVAFTDGALTAIQGLIDLVAGVLTGDWARAWDGIKGILEGVWKAMVAIVRFAWGEVVIAVKAGMRLVKLAVEGFASVLVALGKWVVNRIVDGIEAMAGALVGAAGWVKNRVVEGIRSYAEAWIGVGTWVINRIADGITTITAALESVGGWIKNRIVDLVRATGEGLVELGRWVINRIADGVTTVTDALGAIGGWLKNRIVAFVYAAKDGFLDLGGWIVGRIVDGLKSGVKAVVKFVNAIIGVINKVPGVDIKGISLDDVPGFARGGVIDHDALARGGQITRPMAIVGEEAPRHDEYIIPTNPAYRGRARGLFADLGARLGIPGFAKGGVFMSTSYGPPWTGINGSGVTAAGVDLRPARKAYGVAVDPNVIELGTKLKVQPNPFNYDGTFSAFDTGSAIKGSRLDFYDWRGRDAQLGWGMRKVKVDPQGKGVLGSIGDALESIVTAPLDLIRDIVGQLPSPSDFLPSWLEPMGSWLVRQAKDWITDQIKLGGGDEGSVGGGSASWTKVFDLARKTSNVVTSDYRPGDPGWHGQNRAKDFAGGRMLDFAKAVAAEMGSKLLELIHTPLGYGIKNGKKIGSFGAAVDADHFDHVHIALARGGILGPGGALPFVGSYHGGGVAPREGLAHVLQGETMIPPGAGGGDIHVYIGDKEVTDIVRVVVKQGEREADAEFRAGVAA